MLQRLLITISILIVLSSGANCDTNPPLPVSGPSTCMMPCRTNPYICPQNRHHTKMDSCIMPRVNNNGPKVYGFTYLCSNIPFYQPPINPAPHLTMSQTVKDDTSYFNFRQTSLSSDGWIEDLALPESPKSINNIIPEEEPKKKDSGSLDFDAMFAEMEEQIKKEQQKSKVKVHLPSKSKLQENVNLDYDYSQLPGLQSGEENSWLYKQERLPGGKWPPPAMIIMEPNQFGAAIRKGGTLKGNSIYVFVIVKPWINEIRMFQELTVSGSEGKLKKVKDVQPGCGHTSLIYKGTGKDLDKENGDRKKYMIKGRSEWAVDHDDDATPFIHYAGSFLTDKDGKLSKWSPESGHYEPSSGWPAKAFMHYWGIPKSTFKEYKQSPPEWYNRAHVGLMNRLGVYYGDFDRDYGDFEERDEHQDMNGYYVSDNYHDHGYDASHTTMYLMVTLMMMMICFIFGCFSGSICSCIGIASVVTCNETLHSDNKIYKVVDDSNV